ncbi:hypothetical protein GCM10010274_30260 [Streptomyces lavendofoliae]|uniref:Uncharacterized protein n=1 Tax=Streptomyces lavendofoliae TaxID=67314 RepID=A0A918HY50_9ACTN|nr:hypothetical protein GCM10010274_30260 [Streptomyces lavendofoliae]
MWEQADGARPQGFVSRSLVSWSSDGVRDGRDAAFAVHESTLIGAPWPKARAPPRARGARSGAPVEPLERAGTLFHGAAGARAAAVADCAVCGDRRRID